MQVDLQGLWIENGKKLRKGYKTFTNKNKTTITLLPPPRYEQEWLMRMTPTNKTAFESLEKTFQNYWVENFSLYTVEQKRPQRHRQLDKGSEGGDRKKSAVD